MIEDTDGMQVHFIEPGDPDDIRCEELPLYVTYAIQKVILVRHGESVANAGAATTDPALIPMTPRGEQQARLTAGMVDSPDLILSSPFERAIATAAPLRELNPHVRYDVWPIQEFTFLSPTRCAGTTAQDRKSWVEEYWLRADPHYVDGTGAESFAAFLIRVIDFSKRLEELPFGTTTVVFGHAQFFNAARWLREHEVGQMRVDQVLASITNPMSSFRAFDLKNPIDNCGIFRLL